MALKEWMIDLQPAIELELQQVVDSSFPGIFSSLRDMLAYHMGWEGDGAGPEARGKRIRPLMVLLSARASGGDWQKALPAAAAVELLHNFSLIHDDIEDNSPLRRGRPTVWTRWGMPQALNAGDALFTVSQLAMLRLRETTTPLITVETMSVFNQTCLYLTGGQSMDMAFEQRSDVSLGEYETMIAGKTASLVSACTEIGALVGGADLECRQSFRHFGYSLGMAFQMVDDYLGIWGETSLIGKSTDSDLVSMKKTLPILYAVEQGGAFAERWKEGKIQPEEVPQLAEWLAEAGAREYTLEQADRWTAESLAALRKAAPENDATAALFELSGLLLKRNK